MYTFWKSVHKSVHSYVHFYSETILKIEFLSWDRNFCPRTEIILIDKIQKRRNTPWSSADQRRALIRQTSFQTTRGKHQSTRANHSVDIFRASNFFCFWCFQLFIVLPTVYCASKCFWCFQLFFYYFASNFFLEESDSLEIK